MDNIGNNLFAHLLTLLFVPFLLDYFMKGQFTTVIWEVNC